MTETPTTNTPKDFSVDRYRSFAEIFAYNEKYLFGSKNLVEQKNRKLSYGKLFDLTARFCTWCAAQGLKPGDRAIILSQDDLATISLFMGCLRYGLTAVILNPDGGLEEQNKLIEAAKPLALFVDAELINKLQKPQGCIELAIAPGASFNPPSLVGKIFGKKESGAHFPQVLSSCDPAQEFATLPADTVAYILFTSGTTSKPKGVEITHDNLLAQMKTFVRHYGYNMHARLLNLLPLHHTDGLTQGPVVAFTAGATVCRPLKFAIGALPQMLAAIYQNRITHFIAVPTMLQLIDSLGNAGDDAFKNEHFKFIISTAGYLDPNLWERFEKRFGVMVVNVYGLTETVCEALYCGPTPETRKLGSIGKPVDTECRIVDDIGKEVAIGVTGELWVKGPHIMKGYFEMPEETTEVLSTDGWFKTGDLCKRDEDGFYYIVGRKKNVIIVGGINIYPDDVANILRSLPGVMDAAVWGEQDPTWGETVAAAIIPQPGAAIDGEKVAQDFISHAAVEMAPRQIHVVDEFPRGPAGKVVIRDLREKIAGAKKAAPCAADGDLPAAVIACAAHSFKCPAAELSLGSTAETTKGWNSLAHVEFLLSLEKEFGIKIGPKEILSVRSIGDALKIVEQKKSKAA